MTNQTTDKTRENDKSRLEGEGSYSGSRAYNTATRDFVATGQADKAAQAAERALDSAEGAGLKAAEAKGKAGDPLGKARK